MLLDAEMFDAVLRFVGCCTDAAAALVNVLRAIVIMASKPWSSPQGRREVAQDVSHVWCDPFSDDHAQVDAVYHDVQRHAYAVSSHA